MRAEKGRVDVECRTELLNDVAREVFDNEKPEFGPWFSPFSPRDRREERRQLANLVAAGRCRCRLSVIVESAHVDSLGSPLLLRFGLGLQLQGHCLLLSMPRMWRLQLVQVCPPLRRHRRVHEVQKNFQMRPCGSQSLDMVVIWVLSIPRGANKLAIIARERSCSPSITHSWGKLQHAVARHVSNVFSSS